MLINERRINEYKTLSKAYCCSLEATHTQVAFEDPSGPNDVKMMCNSSCASNNRFFM